MLTEVELSTLRKVVSIITPFLQGIGILDTFRWLSYKTGSQDGRKDDDLKFRGIGMGVKQDYRCCLKCVSNCNYNWLEENIA